MVNINGKFKLSFVGEEYFVNEKKGVVVCKLTCKIQTPKSNDFCLCIGGGEFTMIGKARCAECDTFDETIGRKIARTYAENKAYAKANSLIENILHTLLGAGVDFRAKSADIISHNLEYLHRLDAEVQCSKHIGHGCTCTRSRNEFEKMLCDETVSTTADVPVPNVDSNVHVGVDVGEGKDNTVTKEISYDSKNGLKVRDITREEFNDKMNAFEKDFEDLHRLMHNFFF